MQAVCDSRNRFLEVWLNYPGSVGDYMAFQTSSFRTRIEEPGFLADGLCLFGDNAYVNTFYMATPYPNVRNGPKDSYNFHHSSCRIRIECTFGILVNRWGILRKAISNRMTIEKIISMVFCLCKLHNFLIDSSLDSEPDLATERDNFQIAVCGGITTRTRITNYGESYQSPDELLHIGNGEFEYEHRRRMSRSERRVTHGMQLPREAMLDYIEMYDYRRPRIRRRTV